MEYGPDLDSFLSSLSFMCSVYTPASYKENLEIIKTRYGRLILLK